MKQTRKQTDESIENGSDARPAPTSAPTTSLSREISAIGYILAVSYPVLALSTGVRAGYQLFVRDDIVDYFPSIMSGVAALCYLVATVGFAYRRRWSWWLSVAVLAIETTLTLVVGIWSYVEPAFIGHTVWRHFGADYGYFPFFQPILGLIWLLWPATMREYGFGERFIQRITEPVLRLRAGHANPPVETVHSGKS